MIVKNGIKCSIVPTTIATAFLALSNVSSSTPINNESIDISNIQVYKDNYVNTLSNAVMDDKYVLYYNGSVKNKIIQLFPDSREMTESEKQAYKYILKFNAQKTGVRMF